MSDLVYFVQGADGGPIKIGIAADPEARLGFLQISSPSKLRITRTVEGGREKERELHGRFSDDRIRGEWFRASDALAAYARAKPESKGSKAVEIQHAWDAGWTAGWEDGSAKAAAEAERLRQELGDAEEELVAMGWEDEE